MDNSRVNVIGAGLAGSEAAWQLARRGIAVRLFEMRPARTTEAHQTGLFGELVCSNSLRNSSLETAVGVLKEEMRRLGSLVIEAADRSQVPAGSALAVDRDQFAGILTHTLETHPLVEVTRAEVRRCRRHSRLSPAVRSPPGARRRSQQSDRPAQSLFLRRYRADRDRRFGQHEGRLHSLALWQGRRRLHQLPDGRGAIRRFRRGGDRRG